MKNFFSKLIIIVLTLALSLTFIACDKDGDGEVRVTGKYEYKVMTGTNDDGTSYKYYAITGYQVSSEDAESISKNDYSNIDVKHREITIPATGEELGAPNKEYKVEEISAGAFTSAKILTKVTVGSNIKKIGSGAFANCTNLTEITLPFTGASRISSRLRTSSAPLSKRIRLVRALVWIEQLITLLVYARMALGWLAKIISTSAPISRTEITVPSPNI